MERQKASPILMAAAAIALISTVYVFYITVFEQIINQNQGYFYAVIFGFILLVLFLICNLFTKLVAISVGEQRSSYRKLVITIALVVIASLFLVTRMRYSTLLSPVDCNVYKGAVAMLDGTYSQSHDIIDAAIANPGHYLYSLLLSLIFRFAEPGARPVLWVNAFFIVLSGFLTYKIVRTFTNQMCGLFAAALCALVPSQTFAVYSFSSEPMVAAIFLGAVLSLISLYSYNKRVKEKADAGLDDTDVASLVFTIVGSILIGLLLFVEPFMIIPFALMVLVAYFTKKPKALMMLVSFAAGILIMVFLCYAKSVHMEVDFGRVITGQVSAFDPTTDFNSGIEAEFPDVFASFNSELSSTDKNITQNYMFISDSTGAGAYTEMSAAWVVILNQIMYMFVLMMTISCVILAVKEQKDYVITISMLIVSAVLMLLFQQNRDNQKFLFITVFIIASSTGIHYLYLDHHPELKVGINALDALEKTGRKEIAAATRSNLKNAAQMTEADFMKRAKALIFVGNDEELYHQIKMEEHEKASLVESRRPQREEGALDDYDEDFFLDKEDDSVLNVKVTAVAPSGIRQSVEAEASAYEPNAEMHESASAAYENTSVPAWKRPEKFGDERMFDEDEIELDKAHSSFDGREALTASAGITTNEPAPEVEKIKRNSKKIALTKETANPRVPAPTEADMPKPVARAARHEEVPAPDADNGSKSKSKKMVASAPRNTMAGGKAVRRIKTVGPAGSAAVSVTQQAPIPPSAPLPNPLPTPAKKDHVPMDYDRKVGSDDDWDYDYNVTGGDDDWDFE